MSSNVKEILERDYKIRWTVDKATGYVYGTSKEYPFTDNINRIYKHRFVMIKHLGRNLYPNEVVHHIDNNKLNNNISNLQVMDKGEHTIHHLEENGLLTPVWYLSRDELLKLYEQFNANEIAEMYDVHPATVRYNLKRHNISFDINSSYRKNVHSNNPLVRMTREEFINLYNTHNQKEIAELYKLQVHQVAYAAKIHNARKVVARKVDKKHLERLYKQFTQEQIGKILGMPKSSVGYYITKYNIKKPYKLDKFASESRHTLIKLILSKTNTEIIRMYDISESTFYYVLQRKNINLGKVRYYGKDCR